MTLVNGYTVYNLSVLFLLIAWVYNGVIYMVRKHFLEAFVST